MCGLVAGYIPDSPRQVCLLRFGHVQYAVLMAQRGIFLILVRHSRWERGQVPVNMRIGLLTHQRENIKPICRHCFGYRLANRVDQPLKVQVFDFCEITDRV